MCHANFVTSLEFGFEGQALYSGDRTGTVAVWETIAGDHSIFKVREIDPAPEEMWLTPDLCISFS